jgi:hypothetical protein
MADVITGDSATSMLKQTVVAALVQRELIANSVLAGSIRDVSEFAVDGVDEIEFPRHGSFTVTKKVSGTAVDAAALTFGTDKLTLSEHAVIQWLIEKKASKQSVINLETANLLAAARAHAKQVDVDIHTAMITGVSAASPDHIIAFIGSTFGRADIVKAMELLDIQEWPSSDRFLAVHPSDYATMLNITDFIDASKFGSNQPLINGEIGQIFGMKVLKTTCVTPNRPLVYHRESTVIGFQLTPQFESAKDLANLATRYSLDQLYGVKVTHGGKGIVRLGSAT